jgi:hypothetical protein
MRYISAVHAALSSKHDEKICKWSFYKIPTILLHDGGFFSRWRQTYSCKCLVPYDLFCVFILD